MDIEQKILFPTNFVKKKVLHSGGICFEQFLFELLRGGDVTLFNGF